MPKTAIVTGSARGIGESIALRLAKDGYDVCVNDIEANKGPLDEVAKKVQEMGRKSHAVIADVSKRSEVDRLVKESVEALGPLNTMVANAGIAQIKPLLELTEDDMQRMFSINVFGLHNCYAAAAVQFISQGPPPKPNPDAGVTGASEVYKIIGAASIVAFKPFPMLSHYSASKWAVRGLNQAYAMELADNGITCNCYAPGIVGTAMWDLIDEKLGEMKGVPRGETIKKYTEDLIALKRTSVPKDVSNTVAFLASGDSDYMTGQCTVIDGGIIFT